jgi:hypothetical protein
MHRISSGEYNNLTNASRVVLMIPVINNIFGIRINNVSNNAAISYGNAALKGHQANVKMNSGYTQPGDANFSPLQFANSNVSNDPDVLDMPQSQV